MSAWTVCSGSNQFNALNEVVIRNGMQIELVLVITLLRVKTKSKYTADIPDVQG